MPLLCDLKPLEIQVPLCADAIVTAVSKRAKAQRFTAANAERASIGLIRTGRAAVSVLDTDLIEDMRQVSGYVRTGGVADYARSHFMVPQSNGRDVLYENSLSIEYDAETMPAAVVAADLALSTDTRERSAGLQVLEEMRQQWLASATRQQRHLHRADVKSWT